MVEDGKKAPDFELKDADGKSTRLSGLKGHALVLYFYPKDDTSGCTAEAKDFTCLIDDFKRAGAEVIGVSPDSPESHRKLREKYGLSVRLLAGPRGGRGVWGLGREIHVWAKIYGRRALDLPDRQGGKGRPHLAQCEGSGPRRRGTGSGARAQNLAGAAEKRVRRVHRALCLLRPWTVTTVVNRARKRPRGEHPAA
jgi:peroxiredoxin